MVQAFDDSYDSDNSDHSYQELPSEGCLPSEPITLRGSAATLLRRVIGSKQHCLPASASVLNRICARACSLLFLKSGSSLIAGYWTDNGAYYYYKTMEEFNYEDTLIELHKRLADLQIPARYLEVWKYYDQDRRHRQQAYLRP